MGKVKDVVIEATMNKHGRAKSDALRMLEHTLGYISTNNMYECRYEERDNEYTLKRWRDGHEDGERGVLYALPDWLEKIRAVAIVGGHLKAVRVPPPDNIVWFTTDDDNNLINFMELK
jgi:hypothetical protein